MIICFDELFEFCCNILIMEYLIVSCFFFVFVMYKFYYRDGICGN